MIGFFINFLIIVLAIVCLLLVLIVLMQRPKQEGLGAAFGGGVTDQMWGAQTGNVLQKGTVLLAIIFFVITMILAVLVGKKQEHGNTQLNPKSENTNTGFGSNPGTNSPIIDVDSNPPTEEPAPVPIEEPAPVPIEEPAPVPIEEPAPAPAEELPTESP